MSAWSLRIPTPGQVTLHPIAQGGPLPDDHIEGPCLASVISPGTELACAYRNQDPSKPASGSGYAAVFRVERAGPQSGFAVGDVCFAMVNHASWIRCAGSKAYAVPADMDPVDAALARLALVPWATLTTTTARPPARVAVTGLGIVGNLAAQIFSAAGYQVLACDPVAERRALLDARGIATAAQLPTQDSPWKDQTSLVVECSGHEAAAHAACTVVHKGGEVVLVGVPWQKRSDLHAFDILHAVFHRYVRLRSGWEWEVPREREAFRHGSTRDNLAGAMAWLQSGRISSRGLVQRVDPRDCDSVYRDLAAQRLGTLTAAFDWALVQETACV